MVDSLFLFVRQWLAERRKPHACGAPQHIPEHGRCVVCGKPIEGDSMPIKGIYGNGLAHAGYTDCARGGDPYA